MDVDDAIDRSVKIMAFEIDPYVVVTRLCLFNGLLRLGKFFDRGACQNLFELGSPKG